MVVISVAAAVACGLMAGVFFAFSTFVMKALRSLAPEDGMGAMQAINVTAVEPPLMIGLFGTSLLSVAAALGALTDLDSPGSGWALAGAVLYLGGVLAVTAGFHVPRNNALASVGAHDPDAETRWRTYAASWTRGNHVRTVAPLAAALAFTIAARLG